MGWQVRKNLSDRTAVITDRKLPVTDGTAVQVCTDSGSLVSGSWSWGRILCS